jgi:hypothetical protein
VTFGLEHWEGPARFKSCMFLLGVTARNAAFRAEENDNKAKSFLSGLGLGP